MDLDKLSDFLVWCLAFNYTVLLVWFIAFVFARSWFWRLHVRWFALSDEIFDAVHYGGMAVLKLLILVFNLAPLFALWMIRSGA